MLVLWRNLTVPPSGVRQIWLFCVVKFKSRETQTSKKPAIKSGEQFATCNKRQKCSKTPRHADQHDPEVSLNQLNFIIKTPPMKRLAMIQAMILLEKGILYLKLLSPHLFIHHPPTSAPPTPSSRPSSKYPYPRSSHTCS